MTGDMQDVKHAIARELSGPDFLTVLAGVDTEKAVTIPTPGPAAVFEGEKANLAGFGYPVAEVIGAKTVYGQTDEQGKSAVHEVQVVWTHVGDDELTITAQLERLVRATRDLFWPPTGLRVLIGINAAPLEVVREEYTALMPATDHPFVKGAATTLLVPTVSL